MDYIRAFEQSVERAPGSVAIERPSGETCTYETLHRRTTALAVALDEQVGDARSASLLANGQPAIEVLVAAYKRGIANVPIDTQSAVDQQAFVFENGDARSLVFDEANREAAVDLLQRCDVDGALYVGEGSVEVDDVPVESYEAALDDVSADPGAYTPRGPEGGIYHTSGTTGRPKGVLADQRRSWYASSQLVMDSAIGAEDRALIATPLYHIVTAVSWTFAHLQANATVVPQQSFDPGETLDLVADCDVTNVFLIPAQWRAVVDEQRERPRDLDGVEQARTGGAPIDESTVEAIREHVCEEFYIIYGLTESISNVTVGGPALQRRRPGTVGRATFNWETRVVDPAEPPAVPDPGAVVEPPGSGELLVRSPVATDGYLDRPTAEDELFVDGWIRTGDVARVDEERNLYIVDRIDNMILSGGENVYPQEVEDVLAEHPRLEEVAVIGVPHEKWGEVVKAVVVPGRETVTREELDAFCKNHDRLADFKRPREYEFTADPLPRSPLGKLRRGVISDEFGP